MICWTAMPEIAFKQNSVAQRFLHSNRGRPQNSSHLSTETGLEESTGSRGAVVCSTERVDMQQVGNIQTNALQQAVTVF